MEDIVVTMFLIIFHFLGYFGLFWAHQPNLGTNQIFSGNVIFTEYQRTIRSIIFSKKKYSSMDKLSGKTQKTHFWAILGYFGHIQPNLGTMRFFLKNRALSLFYPYYPLTSPEKTKQSHDPIPRTFITHARTDSRTDGRHFIEPNPLRGGSKRRCPCVDPNAGSLCLNPVRQSKSSGQELRNC